MGEPAYRPADDTAAPLTDRERIRLEIERLAAVPQPKAPREITVAGMRVVLEDTGEEPDDNI